MAKEVDTLMRLRLYAEEVTESEGGNGLGWVNVKDHGAVGDGAADDTAAVQSAIDAATAANGGAIYFPAGVYRVTQTLVLPAVDAGTQQQVAITFHGQFPQYKTFSVVRSIQTPTGGSIIRSTANPMIDCPGGGFSDFSNVNFIARDITFRAQADTTALDLRKLVAVEMDNVVIDTGVWGYKDVPEPTNSAAYALRTPGNNNGAWTILRSLSVAGFWNGIECFEHTDIDNSQVLFCKAAFLLPPAINYPSRFGRVLVVDCNMAFYVSGVHYFSVEQLAIEHYNSTYSGPGWFTPVAHLHDANNLGVGRIRYHVVKGGVGLNNSLWSKLGGAGISAKPVGQAGAIGGQGGYTGALVTLSAAGGTKQSIPNNAFTSVIWNASQYDDAGFWGSGEYLTVPAGVSRIRVRAMVLFEPAPAGRRAAWVEVNNSGGFPARPIAAVPPNAGRTGLNLASGVIDVSAGDTVRLRVHQDSGATLDITDDAPGAATWMELEAIE